MCLLEVAKGLLRIAEGAMAEEMADSPLGLNTAQICKPLVVQHFLLLAGPPHASTLVVQPHPLYLHHRWTSECWAVNAVFVLVTLQPLV